MYFFYYITKDVILIFYFKDNRKKCYLFIFNIKYVIFTIVNFKEVNQIIYKKDVFLKLKKLVNT
jgi:hypothetical protein